MSLLEKVNKEVAAKGDQLLNTVKANTKLKIGLIVSVVIIVLGVIAAACFYSNVHTQVEMKLRAEYDEQIQQLEDKLEDEAEKHEAELEKQKVSYEKKMSHAEDQHAKDIAKKDEKIAEQVERIKILEAEKMVNFNEIKTKIAEVGKLTTLDYYYTYAGTHKDADEFFDIDGWEIPWTKNSFLAQWEGVVACGVNLEKVVIYVDENTKMITVSVPTAEIFYHDVFEDSFEVLDEKNSIFNPITVADKVDFDKKYEGMIFEKIKENRILEDAYENALMAIENIINATPNVVGQYTITFKQIQ